MSADVLIVDNGGANINSIAIALRRIGASTVLSHSPQAIQSAPRIILPGVGSAREGMARLTQRGLTDLIPTLRQPVLGVCLGMQLLFEHSEEDDVSCLGVLRGKVRRLPGGDGLRVPNMGWCPITITQQHPLLAGIANSEYFYFLHSYAVPGSDANTAVARHGDTFAAVVTSGNFSGVQFHPERSSKAGEQLLRNFLAINA